MKKQQLLFVILQMGLKNNFTSIIRFYIQTDGGPLGTMHVAYCYTTNEFS